MPRLVLRTSLLAACMLPLAPEALAQCTGFGGTQAADAPAAEVVGLVGRGETRASGAPAWQPAALAQKLGGGADVRTLALSSAALLLADRTQIRMSANAELRLCDAQPERSLLELIAGRLWARTKRSPANLQLQTPAALAVVRGTDWDVQVEDGGRTTLTVLSGQVEFSNAYGRVDLGPAEQGTAVPGQAPTKRLLVNPRERVQWVAAYPSDPVRWEEFQRPGLSGPLAEVRADVQAGQWSRARERLLALAAQGEGGAAAQLALADLEVADGRLDAAQDRLAAAWQSTQDPRTAARRAELLLALDRGTEARAWLDAARAAAPASAELLLADADWHRLEGRADAALALYREAAARAQGAAQQAAAQAGLGRALLERGDLPAGRAALARAVELAPDNPAYRGEQATAAAEALRLPEAQAGFDAALALAGDDYVSLAGAGLLALKQGDAAAAREQLLKALVIEPRYAQAHLWLAVAEYQLGEPAAAFDALARARQADPNDPIPWQIESILRNDGGEPESAIAAAREALARQPYLKSLNPLASDAQGSANLGKALGDFGLEHWARAYAQQSYYPLWAGSHFFMANRYESSYSKGSEFVQGYLADPLAFGAPEKSVSVVTKENSEWLASASAGENQSGRDGSAILSYSGLTTKKTPVAWRVRVQGTYLRSFQFEYQLFAPLVGVNLGIRPVDRLSILFLHNQDRTRLSYPANYDLGSGSVLNRPIRQFWRRTEAGGSWRWSADEQTWFKAHGFQSGQNLTLDNMRIGTQESSDREIERGTMMRHIIQEGSRRVSFGWEQSRTERGSSTGDSVATFNQRTEVRFDLPWAAYEDGRGPWSWHLQATWPRIDVDWRAREYDRQTGQDYFAPLNDGGRVSRRVLPRIGLGYNVGVGRILSLGYMESMRGIGAHTLAPVSVGGIPIDFQYHLPGAFARKSAVQLDWELDARSFAFFTLSRQEIINPTYASDGSLLVPFQTLSQFDMVEGLGPQEQTAQTPMNPYNTYPEFSRGRLRQAGFAYSRILTSHWAGSAGYTWTQSHNDGLLHKGNILPGFARHSVVITSVWKHGRRTFTGGSLVYRSARFEDEGNQRLQASGWD